MPMKRFAIACSTLLLFAPFAVSQRPMAIPMAPPPAPHPGLVAQPLMPLADTGAQRRGGGGGAMPDCAPRAEQLPETAGPKLAGKELQRAVAKVKALEWLGDFEHAKARSAATGKPVLWLQALGDIDGFA